MCPNTFLLKTLFTSYLWAGFISLEEKHSTFLGSILIVASLIHQNLAINTLPDSAEPKANTIKVPWAHLQQVCHNTLEGT